MGWEVNHSNPKAIGETDCSRNLKNSKAAKILKKVNLSIQKEVTVSFDYKQTSINNNSVQSAFHIKHTFVNGCVFQHSPSFEGIQAFFSQISKNLS